MPQTAPPDPDTPRPLPRRPVPRPPQSRASRPPFQPLDGLWALGLAALALAHLALRGDLHAPHTGAALAAALTVAALYGLGWRARDRAAGVTAAGLAAASGPFLHAMAVSGQSAPATLLLTAALVAFVWGSALVAFVWGSSLVALGLCALAALLRPDTALLGLLLLGLSLAQHRRRALYGAAVFGVPLLAAWSGRIALGHGFGPLPTAQVSLVVLVWLFAPAALLLIAMLLPLAGEMSEPTRRARWLPTLLWFGLYALFASVLHATTPTGMLLPLAPPLFALAGGGLSRLLPTLAGEFPGPGPRYVLAVLAVLGLVGLHTRLELPSTSASSEWGYSPAPPALPALPAQLKR